MNLDLIQGDLGKFRRFREGTFQHIDQVIGAYEIGSDSLYTADGYGYFVDNGRVKLAVTRGEHNPILSAITEEGFERVKQQLENNKGYWLGSKQTLAIISSISTTVFDVESLEGMISKDYWGGYGIHIQHWTCYRSNDYNEIITNSEQKRFMQRLGLDPTGLNAVLETENHFCQTHIQLLSPNSVKRRLKTKGESLWCVSLLRPERFDSYEKSGNAIIVSLSYLEISTHAKLFGALDNDSSTAKRVRESPLSQHYNAIITDTAEAIKALDDTTAQRLLKIIADYKRLKK